MKGVLNLSKDPLTDPKLRKTALQIVRNVTGQGAMNAKLPSSYIPTSLAESSLEITNLEEVVEALANGSQEQKSEALQQLADKPKLVSELSVRFDYYWKATGMFSMQTIKDKTAAKTFSQVVKMLTLHTSR